MVFHLGFELPSPAPAQPLAPGTDQFTREEVGILRRQIRKNAEVIDTYIHRIDLFVNQEKYPQREAFIQKIRRRMFLLMEENDTFRQVLCRHLALSLE